MNIEDFTLDDILDDSYTNIKLNQLTIKTLKQYLHIDYEDDDFDLALMLKGALAFIIKYTGKTYEQLCTYDDIVIVVIALCGEMFDERRYTTTRNSVSKIVKGMLDSYCEGDVLI